MGRGSFGLECTVVVVDSMFRKRNGSGLVFVRHSLLLLLCSVIVEALRYKGIDVSVYWTNALISWVFIVAGVD